MDNNTKEELLEVKSIKDHSSVPRWILRHLYLYGNCCCGYDIVHKYGERRLLELLDNLGFNCYLRIIEDHDYPIYYSRKLKYPPNAYYILEVGEVLTRKIYN